jgi:CheY-like chemotaxis protein
MASSGVPLRVLVVEDDQLVRTFVSFALSRDGMQVAAVLADGLLPDMHGIELATRILDAPATAGLPICFLSGAVPSRVPTRAGIGCLSKPVKPGHLAEQIRALVAWRDEGGSPLEERRAALRKLEAGFLVGP